MKNLGKALFTICVISIGLGVFALSHQVGGFKAFVVSSGSMEPTLHTGSLIVTRYTHPKLLQKNDVITFVKPSHDRSFVTHRIQDISQKDGVTVIKTKGDHNIQRDNWVVAGGSVVGKVVTSIPYFGYFFSFAHTKMGIILLVLLPSVFIIAGELSHAYKLIRKKQSASAQGVAHLTVSLFLLTCMLTIDQSAALLSDSVTLSQTTMTFQNTHSTPLPQSNQCTITITGNGAGSQNSATCTHNITNTVIQENTTTVTTNSESTGNANTTVIIHEGKNKLAI